MFLPKVQLPRTKSSLTILALLALALVFRIHPELYIMGGEDQGVYVNSGIYYQEHPQILVPNLVRKKITSVPLRQYYDANNHFVGSYLPGLYFKNHDKNHLIFQFYKLHPLWFAICAKLFGPSHATASMIWFSLLSILFFSLIVFEISNNYLCGFVAGTLLALNPIHIFFSKFPTSEITTQAFLFSGFYYLIKYYKLATQKNCYSVFYLLISGLSIGCAFLSHIDTFIILPWFLFFFLVSLLFAPSILRLQLNLYFLGILFLFSLSVFLGLVYSFPYTFGVYWGSINNLGSHAFRLLGLGCLGYFILLLAAGLFKIPNAKVKNFLIKVHPLLNQILLMLLFIVFFISFWRIYQLAYSTAASKEPIIFHFHYIVNHGLSSLLFSTFIATFFYLSPLAMILFLYALVKPYPMEPIFLTGLLIFALIAWAYSGILNYTVPYEYFYSRFILSYAIPITILFISLKIGQSMKKVTDTRTKLRIEENFQAI